MTTFKAVDGWTFDHDIEEIFDGQEGVVDGRLYQRSPEDMKCTIIPGHWASQIESGELLTEEERRECRAPFAEEMHPIVNVVLDWAVVNIARKLRGEA